MIRIFMMALLFSATVYAEPCTKAPEQIAKLARDSGYGPIRALKIFEKVKESLDPDLRAAYCSGVLENIDAKRSSLKHGVRFSAEELKKHVILYERFRLKSYLDSGISPKRYFGFFDERGNTADYEKLLRQVLIKAVPIINDFAASSGLDVRITEKEIAVTFLAEGGAVMLDSRIAFINKVHPVRDIGLDHYRIGFRQYFSLVRQLDQTFGTGLSGITWNFYFHEMLLRPLTFREAILATAIMYLYEKQLAADKYFKLNKAELRDLDLNRQFIYSSLVYNSGLMFADERVEQIRTFNLGNYLSDAHIKNRHQRTDLPVFSETERRGRLVNGEVIPEQLTTWNTVYNVLQRYGAWVAVEKFSDTFNADGAYRVRNLKQ